MKMFDDAVADATVAVGATTVLIILITHLVLSFACGSSVISMLQTWFERLRIWRLGKLDEVHSFSVESLHIYPVKSLRGTSVKNTSFDSLGLVNDRRWMLVIPRPPRYDSKPNDPTHRFLTQRQNPVMATISVRLDDKDGHLFLECGPENFKLPIGDTATQKQKPLVIRLFDSIVEGFDCGDDVAQFLEQILLNPDKHSKDVTSVDDIVGKGVRLVKLHKPCPVDASYIPPVARNIWGQTPDTAFTDGYPILITNTHSLDELNKRLAKKGKEALAMKQFRPNLVISGTKPFEEDNWKVIRIGQTILHIVKGCPRCKLSCTDQTTGQVSEEPLETLSEFRALGKDPSNIYFGQNAIAYGPPIQVGMQVEILRRGEPVWDRGAVPPE